MKKLTSLVLFAAVTLGCSVESADSNEEFFSNMKGKNNSEISVTEYEGPGNAEFVQNSGKVRGHVYVSNDCNNLYVEIVPTGDQPDDPKIGVFQTEESFPPTNGTDSGIPDNSAFLENLTWTFPLEMFDTTQPLNIFVKAWGTWAGNISWGNQASYFDFSFQEVTCDEVCTHGKGYWWNHGPNGNPGNQNNEWPESVTEDGMTLGTNPVAYTAAQLGQIYDRNTAKGNGLVSVAHHLITAKLNIANGADPSAVIDAVEEADLFIGDLNPLVDSRNQSEVGAFKETLENYNEGLIGPGKCEDSEK